MVFASLEKGKGRNNKEHRFTSIRAWGIHTFHTVKKEIIDRCLLEQIVGNKALRIRRDLHGVLETKTTGNDHSIYQRRDDVDTDAILEDFEPSEQQGIDLAVGNPYASPLIVPHLDTCHGECSAVHCDAVTLGRAVSTIRPSVEYGATSDDELRVGARTSPNVVDHATRSPAS